MERTTTTGERRREGPIVNLELSCRGCRHEHTEKYAVQGDSGQDVYCVHPSVLSGFEGKTVGDTTWNTPDWCPLLPQALLARFNLMPMGKKGNAAL